ncbi:MAG: hypothetical protein ACREHG_09305, partial [Candidatus Saccharimonadales bacterium]
AAQCASLFFREIVRLHGIPASIISDRDPRFTGKFWRELWSLCGSRLRMSTAYHPQTDGQVERMNRTVEEVLRAYVNQMGNDWDQHLTAVELAINSSKQSSTQRSPFYLNYGQEVNLPLDIAIKAAKQAANPAAADVIQQLHHDIEVAKSNIARAQAVQKAQADQHRREVHYSVGDEVMLNNSDWLKTGRKLRPKYWGPFKVIAVPSDLTVTLELPSSMSRMHNTFHVSKVKLYKEAELLFPDRQQLNRPPPVVEDDQGKQYTVETLLGKKVDYIRVRGRGGGRKAVTKYLVKWLGYSMEECTWEPEANIEDEEIAEYEYRVSVAEGSDDDDGEASEMDQ